MEWLIQEVNLQCYLPTIYNFLWFYLKAARSDEDVDKTAKYLAVLALLSHEQLCYWPSTVAASLDSLWQCSLTSMVQQEIEKYNLAKTTRTVSLSDVDNSP
ncbi:hypothetical protein L1987_36447 [Smallanthus sonchifolius]|uniref:Uncharacterized protein n=1 Tax=Smallanthus sonchifolius TaxID=185202 RepID=A0ACB9HD76_9ASTR|nr:hypothetical protein L1987_36447 [Smallanthus sonchifolius]